MSKEFHPRTLAAAALPHVHAFALPDVCPPCARRADRETNDNCYGPMTYYAYKIIQEGQG